MLKDEMEYAWLLDNHWTSIDRKLPNRGELVLLYSSDPDYKQFVGYLGKNSNTFYIEDFQESISVPSVTHWRPLPEPPNDSE